MIEKYLKSLVVAMGIFIASSYAFGGARLSTDEAQAAPVKVVVLKEIPAKFVLAPASFALRCATNPNASVRIVVTGMEDFSEYEPESPNFNQMMKDKAPAPDSIFSCADVLSENPEDESLYYFKMAR